MIVYILRARPYGDNDAQMFRKIKAAQYKFLSPHRRKPEEYSARARQPLGKHRRPSRPPPEQPPASAQGEALQEEGPGGGGPGGGGPSPLG